MSHYEDSNGTGVLQLNAELHEAHVELLSAHCATHQLRLRYSSDDLARLGRRDVLRKSAAAASQLNNFYAEIERKATSADSSISPAEPTRAQIVEATGWISAYLQEQRDHYWPVANPLSNSLKARLWPYFTPEVLEEVRVVELRGNHVSIPEFFSRVRALGFEPPPISHMDSITFLNVVVFNQELNERALFHALVHFVQMQVLGLDRYAELWVEGFVRARAHYTVPLEVHAFSLASKFLRPTERFSVVDSVLQWSEDRRY